MAWRSLATAFVAATAVGLWCNPADGQLAGRTAPGRGAYSDPHFGVYTWQGNATGQDALVYYLSAQHREARRLRAEQAAADAAPAATSAFPLHRMHPGGASAGGYFGRRTVVNPGTPPAGPSRYNRLGTYFGGRGR